MDSKKLLERIEQLPALKRMEAEDFIEFLTTQQRWNGAMPPMTFAWAGGLSDLKKQYTSRDLKKKALEFISPHLDAFEFWDDPREDLYRDYIKS
jgi:hypothetical protein